MNHRGAALVAGLAVAAMACAPAPAPMSRTRPVEPRWQDVLEANPQLLVVVRPKALELDEVYGPLLRRAMAVAKQRYRIVSETRVLDAVEGADELIVALDVSGQAPSTLFVERGVRADIDPARLVDADGRALWSAGSAGPIGPVRELQRNVAQPVTAPDGGPEDLNASLFELPERTWVIATGPARVRARDVFLRPTQRPAPSLDPDALVLVRLDGPTLVARLPALQPHGGLSAIGRGLQWASFELPRGPEGRDAGPPLRERAWEATLLYGDLPSAAAAEAKARDIVGAFGRTKPDGMEWIGGATVDRNRERYVVLTAPLPTALIERLLHVGDAIPSPVPL